MVKVLKPNPKSIKKDVPKKAKQTQVKKAKVNLSKEKVKKIGKALESDAKNKIIKDVIKQKNADFNKKSKIVQEKVKQTGLKKKATVGEVPKKVKQTVQKKKPIISEYKEKVRKTTLKKTTLASRIGNKNKPAGHKIKGIQKKKGDQKSKVEIKEIKSPIFEPANFDEEKLKDILSLENITKIIKALNILVEKEVSEKKTSIFSDYRYFLNISSYKIPNCPKRMVKLNLEHSLVDTAKNDIVMVVPDLQRGAKVDYEPTIQHYEDLLREIGVENIKIMPFNQLRNEYTSFEAKRKFANTYDYFLCDGRIVGNVVGFCGKHFQKPRTTFHAVRLSNPKTYKKDIEHALKRTSFRHLRKGDMISIPVGNHLFTVNQLAENIKVIIEQLKTIFPGGYANIRNVYVKIDIKGTSSLPLYVNLAGPPAEVPNVIGPREQRMLKLKKQANEILSKFSMSKAGDFVKLSKTQAEHKRQIRQTRTALLSKESVVADEVDGEFDPSLRKKVKKDETIGDSKSKFNPPLKKKVKKNKKI